MTELKPCPKCKSTNIEPCDDMYINSLGDNVCTIKCADCGIEIASDGDFPIEEWNTRRSPWIPISDAVPQLMGDGMSNNVDCLSDGERDIDCQYSAEGWYNMYGEKMNPSHWMPIPANPDTYND